MGGSLSSVCNASPQAASTVPMRSARKHAAIRMVGAWVSHGPSHILETPTSTVRRLDGRPCLILCRVNRVPVDLDEFVSFLDQPRGGPVRAYFDRTTGRLEPMPRDAE